MIKICQRVLPYGKKWSSLNALNVFVGSLNQLFTSFTNMPIWNQALKWINRKRKITRRFICERKKNRRRKKVVSQWYNNFDTNVSVGFVGVWGWFQNISIKPSNLIGIYVDWKVFRLLWENDDRLQHLTMIFHPNQCWDQPIWQISKPIDAKKEEESSNANSTKKSKPTSLSISFVVVVVAAASIEFNRKNNEIEITRKNVMIFMVKMKSNVEGSTCRLFYFIFLFLNLPNIE